MTPFIAALRQRHLDLSFRAAGGFTVEIAERPGLWMTDDRREALSADLRQVARATLTEGALDYGVFSGDANRLGASIVTLVRDTATGRPVAFNALALMEMEVADEPQTVIHLGLVMVDPSLRSRGLSWILYGLTCVLLLVRGGFRPIPVSNVTQVPAVVGMVAETFTDVFPRPDARRPSDFRKVLTARAIMASHRHVFGVGEDAVFDEDRFVIENAYTGGSDDLMKTFEDAQKHRDPAFNAFCADVLDYDRGDDVLQLGRIDLAAARRYVLRSVPRGSLLQVAALAALLMLQRAVLPVTQWFDTTTRFGLLRAR